MLSVDTTRTGEVVTLRIQGSIVNGAEAATLRKSVFAQEAVCVLVLDLGAVNLIDGGGLGELLRLREWTRSKGIELRLMNVTGIVQQVLEITRLNTVFEISEGEPQSTAVRRHDDSASCTAACA